MKLIVQKALSIAVVVMELGAGSVVSAQETIDTRIGKLELENGYPSKETAAKLYDEMDFQRACQAYLWAFPAVSFQSFQTGLFRDLGANYNDIAIWDNFLDTKGLFLTGNNTTIYAVSILNLANDGPIVIEIPPGPTAGVDDDFWQRSTTELGRTGPDKGNGGKFLLVPPDYKGDLPAEGYFTVRAPMNSLNCLIRGIVQGGDVAGTVTMMKKIRVYPFSQRENPKPNRFLSATGKAIDFLLLSGFDL